MENNKEQAFLKGNRRLTLIQYARKKNSFMQNTLFRSRLYKFHQMRNREAKHAYHSEESGIGILH